MNRTYYFNLIEKNLSLLSFRIAQRAKLNLLDLNIYSESFFKELLHLLLGYTLENKNMVSHNSEAIDLVDDTNKIMIQVSSTCSKQKLESSLEKAVLSSYKDYTFKFMVIAHDATTLRKQTIQNPHNVLFDAKTDIIDIPSILKLVLDMGVDKQKALCDFVKRELEQEIDVVKMDTNLAAILQILSTEPLGEIEDSCEINPFEIENKIEFNQLLPVADIIDEYKIYYGKVNEKYKEFDKLGTNKTISVLRIIRREYITLATQSLDAPDLFFKVIENITKIITDSKNYVEIPYEELNMYVSILVVDAFIKCKIFKNPEGYHYVASK